jgi:CRP/FNR family cyclic AMP-dependent transcriptional regulator
MADEPKRDRPPGELAEADRSRLINRFGRPFAAGDALFREGDPAREAFRLQEGRVRLVKRVRSVERSLMVVRPGDLFGESALLDDSPRNSTAVALTPGVALALDRTTFRPLLENHPNVATRVLDQLIRRVRDAEDQIELMMLRDTQSKVVSALLKLSHVAAGGAQFTLSPAELSSRVGVDVELVKRVVQRLREQGYLHIAGDKVDVPDVLALRRLYDLLGTKEDARGPR